MTLSESASASAAEKRGADRGRLAAWTPRRKIFSLACAALFVAASAFGFGVWFSAAGKMELSQRTQSAAALRARTLESKLEKYRSAPLILSGDAGVAAALRTPDEKSFALLNERFERLADEMRVAAIYLIDVSGLTVAASNWRDDASFLGENYTFRSYYTDAIATGVGEDFALGTVSGRPGLYLARRVGGESDKPLGVIVVKVQFDDLEAQWTEQEDVVLAANPDGVVLVTNEAALRFETFRPQMLGAGAARSALADKEALAAHDWSLAQAPIETNGWTLYVLSPSDAIVRSMTTAGRVVGASLALTALAALALFLSQRARRRRLLAEEERYRTNLEADVASRTHELKESNRKLIAEMEERSRAQEKLHRMQDDLVQANKLAVLGQIAAGVAHEINQPLSAIMSYLGNTGRLIDRGDLGRAAANLSTMTGLAERIGLITGELRTFARKRPAAPAVLSAEEAIDGALLLTAARMRALDVSLARRRGAGDARVRADKTRLEQVMANLLQNAMDALDGVPAPAIDIETRIAGDDVEIVVTDNGSGVPQTVAGDLFAPFRSSKETGLGLGLVISRDIMSEFGGGLDHRQPPGGRGAQFIVRMPRAL